MNIALAEWVGYLASGLIALSLLITNVWYFRWINMAGGLFFALYGLAIGSMPIIIVNTFIALIDLYFIIQMTRRIDYFHYIRVANPNDSYLQYFLRYYTRDIGYHFPRFPVTEAPANLLYTIILRNAVPVGVFAYHVEGHEGIIDLDYIVPDYRDLKNTTYLIRDGLADEFAEKKIERLTIQKPHPRHLDYLGKMGFREAEERSDVYHLQLPPAT